MKTASFIFHGIRVCTITFLISHMALAIDNPDAPNDLNVFEEKSQKYEKEIGDVADNNRMVSELSRNYLKFLDDELNSAYHSVLDKVDEKQQRSLQTSQKAWLQYRDTEFAFIEANWTPDNFGSSSALSKSLYRSTIIRDRVRGLLSYLKNY
jgi:uncharacterized protein YecT (DUF1311 family)